MDCLNEFLIAFIDDLLIYSNNKLEYKAYMKKILEWLYKAGL